MKDYVIVIYILQVILDSTSLNDIVVLRMLAENGRDYDIDDFPSLHRLEQNNLSMLAK